MVLPAALVVDFDGLIMDTESAEIDAIRRVLRDQGHELRTDAFVAAVGAGAVASVAFEDPSTTRRRRREGAGSSRRQPSPRLGP